MDNVFVINGYFERYLMCFFALEMENGNKKKKMENRIHAFVLAC